MFSLASTETQSSIESSVCVGHGQFERGPLLVAGREPPGRRHNTDTAQLLRLTGFKVCVDAVTIRS